MTEEEDLKMNRLGQRLIDILIEIHNHAFNASDPTEQFNILNHYYNSDLFLIRTYRGTNFLKVCPDAVKYKKTDCISTIDFGK